MSLNSVIANWFYRRGAVPAVQPLSNPHVVHEGESMMSLLDSVQDPLIDVRVAAARVQPRLHGLNARAWLADLRRSVPRYRRRVLSPPKYVTRDGRTMYPSSEIDRLIWELAICEPVILM